jgi:OTU domain-containing protein 3
MWEQQLIICLGNCLFYSFSDQVHGDPSQAREIRQQVVQYMRDNAEDFKPFINVEVGGGSRRNPKRKNVAAAAVTLVYTPPTQEQVDAAWEAHLDRMSRNGTYGDHIEIRAFTKAFDVDVKIYNRSNSYYIKAEENGTRPVIHIAHHVSTLSSSIHNVKTEQSLTFRRTGSITHLSATLLVP